MFDIHYDSLELELGRTSSLIPITIRDSIRERIVYIRKHILSGFWAIDLFGNEAKIFPSSKVEILKIGGREVQSKSSYNEEKKIRHQVLREKQIKESYLHKKRLEAKTNV